MAKKKYKKKMNQKYSDPYKICRNCNGNGYVRIIPYSETQTCRECKGAGHFEHDKKTTTHGPKEEEKDVISTEYVLKLIRVLEDFIRGKKRTIH
jgi:DnaJ-class molecular chaperone